MDDVNNISDEMLIEINDQEGLRSGVTETCKKLKA